MDFPAWSVAVIAAATAMLGAVTKASLPIFGFISNHEKWLWEEMKRRDDKHAAEIKECRSETAACRAETAACRAEMNRIVEMHDAEMARVIAKYEDSLKKVHDQKHGLLGEVHFLSMQSTKLMMEVNELLKGGSQPLRYSDEEVGAGRIRRDEDQESAARELYQGLLKDRTV